MSNNNQLPPVQRQLPLVQNQLPLVPSQLPPIPGQLPPIPRESSLPSNNSNSSTPPSDSIPSVSTNESMPSGGSSHQIRERRPRYPGPEDYIKCNINVNEFMESMSKLGLSLAASKNFDESLDVIMTEDFYKKVIDIVNIMDKYNFKNAQCMIDNVPTRNNITGKDTFCKNEYQDMIDSKKLARLANVIDKYESVFKKVLEKVYTVAYESQKYCNLDPEVSTKMRILVAKLGVLLANDDTIKQKCLNYRDQLNDSICTDSVLGQTFTKRGNYIGYIVIICIVILLLVIFWLLYKSRSSEKINTSEPIVAV